MNPDTRCDGPTEIERLEMCGPDPVRNSDLGLDSLEAESLEFDREDWDRLSDEY